MQKKFVIMSICAAILPIFAFGQNNPVIELTSGRATPMQKKDDPAKPPFIAINGDPAWNKGGQPTTQPPPGRMQACQWDSKNNQYICSIIDKDNNEHLVAYPLKNGINNTDFFELMNRPFSALIDPKRFIWGNDGRLHFDASIETVKMSQAMKAKTMPNTPPTAMVSPETPLARLSPGQMKPLPVKQPTGSHLLDGLSLQVNILNRLRPSINGGLLTFASGAPFNNRFYITPVFIDNNYQIKYKDLRYTPSLRMLQPNGDLFRRPVIDLIPRGFQEVRPQLDAESPVLQSPSETPSGPGSETLAAQEITISQEIQNALQNGTISWSIFIKLYDIQFGGVTGVNGKVELITNKDGSQVGFNFIHPKNPLLNFQYIFTDEKNKQGIKGSDGIFDTVHLYKMNADGIMKEIKVLPQPSSERKK